MKLTVKIPSELEDFLMNAIPAQLSHLAMADRPMVPRAASSIQHRWQVGSCRFVVKSGRHQGHDLYNAQAVPQAPLK